MMRFLLMVLGEPLIDRQNQPRIKRKRPTGDQPLWHGEFGAKVACSRGDGPTLGHLPHELPDIQAEVQVVIIQLEENDDDYEDVCFGGKANAPGREFWRENKRNTSGKRLLAWKS